MAALRLAFMGTPEFSVPALEALLDAGHEVAAVYSQPPRPAGRGKQLRPSPVQVFAEERGIEVRTPRSLKDEEGQQAFADLNLDAAVVVAYGLILPSEILEAPRLGCFNIHASLLPRWRGAAPIQRAILAGDARSGVTIMRMDEGLDTGPILLQEGFDLTREETGGSLHDRLRDLGARLIVRALEGVSEGSLEPRPQPKEGVTYARKIENGEEVIDWRRPLVQIERQIRAFAPKPGARTTLPDGSVLKILKASPVRLVSREKLQAGMVMDDELAVVCGIGALRLDEVQPAGKRPMAATDYLRGNPLKAGQILG